jgi:hypothetical protein
VEDPQQALRASALLGRFEALCSSDEAPGECVGDCLLKLLLGHAAGRHVEKGPERSGHTKAGAFLDVLRGKPCLVEDTPRGRIFPKGRWDGEVDFRGEEFREVMEHQGRLVGHHGLGLVLAVSAPEGKPNEVVMLARGEASEPVEPVFHALEVACGNVIVEVGIVVTSLFCLLCGEIAGLLQGFGEEAPRRFS